MSRASSGIPSRRSPPRGTRSPRPGTTLSTPNKIIADGKGNPWCIGIEQALLPVGKPLTGWRKSSSEQPALTSYNKWITGEVKFDSPESQGRLRQGRPRLLHPELRLLVAHTAIVATSTKTAMDPMFTDDLANPGCWMQNVPVWYGPGPSRSASIGPAQQVHHRKGRRPLHASPHRSRRWRLPRAQPTT